MPRGTVKWFSAKKGYGFLVEEETGEEVFVHHTVIQAEGYRTLDPGAAVEFHKEHTGKGSRALLVVTL